MAMSYHLFGISTQIPGVPRQTQYGVALVLIGIVLSMNAVSIAFRMYLRNKKKW
jgi:phosphate transport system permease protein